MNSREYEPLVGFDLWITRTDDNGAKKKVRKPVIDTMILPKSKKRYRVTLKNVKVFVKELKEIDPTINKIEIIRLSYSGTYNFDK